MTTAIILAVLVAATVWGVYLALVPKGKHRDI